MFDLLGTWRNSQIWDEELQKHSSWGIKPIVMARTNCSCKKSCFVFLVCLTLIWIHTLNHQLVFQDNPPYDKGAFRIEIIFPTEYPFKPPKITFKTKIYHPNIDEKGQVCLPVISAENWKPATKTDQGGYYWLVPWVLHSCFVLFFFNQKLFKLQVVLKLLKLFYPKLFLLLNANWTRWSTEFKHITKHRKKNNIYLTSKEVRAQRQIPVQLAGMWGTEACPA